MADFASLGGVGEAYLLKDRGYVVAVKNPGGYPDPGVLTGRVVTIDGNEFLCRGVESFAIALPYPDRLDFGLLISIDDWERVHAPGRPSSS